jgi:hypothetical protein
MMNQPAIYVSIDNQKFLYLAMLNNRYSNLLDKCQECMVRIDKVRNSFEYKNKKDQRQRLVEALRVAVYSDSLSVIKKHKKVDNGKQLFYGVTKSKKHTSRLRKDA